jgi:hypothetical protein
MSEIEALEEKYNQGNRFPKAFRELLFIAGKRCWARESPTSFDVCMERNKNEIEIDAGYSVGRPYFIFEDGRNGGDMARIFYLDENDDDPYLYDIEYNDDWDDLNNVPTYDVQIELLGLTLVELIEKRVRWNLERLKKGTGY